ncbi:hypothetical protein [Streptacidiphilus sp. EB103A]|uniref:terpene synthase family protein n=1 Tax=Streptacidiphilus sp. EB103A TaxID=3156275 RepID=UPI00351468C9
MPDMPTNLPPLYAPFPYAIHDAADHVEKGTVEFLDRFQLYWDDAQRTRMVEIRNGYLAAMQAPEGPVDRLQCLADFCTWAFAWDDEYCDERPIAHRPGDYAVANARLQRAIEIAEYPLDPTDRYGAALHDIRIRLDACADPGAGEDFTDWVLAYLRTEIRRVTLAAAGLREDPSAYVHTRLVSGGGMVFPRLSATVTCGSVPGSYRTDRRVRALTEMSALLVDVENDVFSLPKELERNLDGKMENLVILLSTEQGIPVSQALDEVVSLVHRTAGLYMRLHDNLLSDAPAELARYVRSIDSYWNGCNRWQRDSPRYLHRDGPDGDVQPRELTETLTGASTGAPPLPHIAWWWEYDPARG